MKLKSRALVSKNYEFFRHAERLPPKIEARTIPFRPGSASNRLRNSNQLLTRHAISFLRQTLLHWLLELRSTTTRWEAQLCFGPGYRPGKRHQALYFSREFLEFP